MSPAIWFLALSTAFFLAGFLYAVAALRTGRHDPTKLNLAVLGLGFLAQLAFLHLRGELHGRCPITNVPEILVFISWSIALLYFVLGRAFRLSLLGTFTAPMVFVFQMIALVLLLINDPGPRKRDTVDPWFEVHVSVSLLAYGAFALAAVAGVMYLVQDRQLKKHRMGSLFHNLPPIRYLVDALVRVIGIGLMLFGAGIATAFFVAVDVDLLHTVAPIVVWAMYATLLGLFLGRLLGPKKFAASAAIGFAVPLLLLAVLT